MPSRSWSRLEVEATVADYLAMLASELRGDEYSKTEHRRTLQPLLDGRNDAAIEQKRRNISAILNELGIPYLTGYKPATHYQGLLKDVVVEHVAQAEQVARLVTTDVQRDVSPPKLADILASWVKGPSEAELQRLRTAGERVPANRPPRSPDYVLLEAENRRLGLAGEEFVVDFERARLLRAGRDDWAKEIEHVSTTRGDGLGFDVKSFNEDGSERLIEVKTTKYGMYRSFYVSRNELAVSQARSKEYHLYRVFDFRRSPLLFTRPGPLDLVCRLDPIGFLGRVA